MSYQDWRATVPWTNDQIAAALEADAAVAPNEYMRMKYQRLAEWVRSGRLSSKALSQALPRLVKVCAVCQKVALYRMGNEGRCRAHKHVLSKPVVTRRIRNELSNADFQQKAKEKDARDLPRIQFAGVKRRSRKP